MVPGLRLSNHIDNDGINLLVIRAIRLSISIDVAALGLATSISRNSVRSR